MPHEPIDDLPVTALNEVSDGPKRRSVRSYALDVVAGPDAGKSFPIDANREPRVLVGQSPACSVRLTDPTVSRRHAAFELVGDALRLTDLGSRNGTWVNHLHIYDAVLSGGEIVRIGTTELRVELRGEVEQPATDQTHFGAFVGVSPEIRSLYPTMAR